MHIVCGVFVFAYIRTQKKQIHRICLNCIVNRRLLCLVQFLVRNSQFFSAFCTAGCQYTTAILGSHSLTESVFIPTLSLRRLECSFHCHNIYPFLCFVIIFIGLQKYVFFLNRANNLVKIAAIFHQCCRLPADAIATHLCSRHLATHLEPCRR